ncbi:MAG TPA: hypothetical protein GXX42_07500 [Petrimonas sp.]|uniref:DUF6904 family protein n=1 Tax=Petrimonas sp. TaxID=2023866 RepID=UPI0017768353|nr:hypothetical protein [Petrimonas sp.]
MLQAYPTKKGTGVEIYGTRDDLVVLYETVHKIANTLDGYNKFQKAQFQLLMNFAYEIRKGYEGSRLVNDIPSEDETKIRFYGFQLVWTDVLIFISTLRHNAGYLKTDRLDQANMYILEYITEKALFAYDAEGANNIKNFIGQRIDITNQLSFVIYQALQIKYVTSPAGKKRFRNIPNLLITHFSEWLPEYKSLVHSLEISAKEHNCDITDLEFDDFPDIKW